MASILHDWEPFIQLYFYHSTLLGYTNNQYVIIDHHRSDPGHDWTHDHDHIHIAVNAIDLDGKRTRDSWEKMAMQRLLRQQEIAHNLTRVPSSWEQSKRSPTHGQAVRYKKEKREYEEGKRSEPPQVIVSQFMQDAIALASADKPTVSEFVSRLQEQGIEVYPRLVKGRTLPQGFSYTYDGVQIPGYKLSCASFPKLLKERGLRFSPSRDIPVLEEARARSQRAMAATAKDELTTPITPTTAAEKTLLTDETTTCRIPTPEKPNALPQKPPNYELPPLTPEWWKRFHREEPDRKPPKKQIEL